MRTEANANTARTIDGVVVHIHVGTPGFAATGTLAAKAAAVQAVIDALPGEELKGIDFGEPGGTLMQGNYAPPDIAPPPAVTRVDDEPELTEVPATAAV